MQFKESIKSFLKQNRRQVLTVVSALIVVCALFMTGVFSYFHGSDVVANRLTAPQGSVTIHEPKWDSKGQNMAANAEPGMEIQKDPTGWNNGSVDVYIRLKMTVSFESYRGTLEKRADELTDEEKANGEISIPDDAEKLRRVLNQIKLLDANENDSPFMSLSEGTWNCHNSNFYCEQDTNDLSTFYFYYTAGNKDGTGADLMCRVAPNHSTDELFQRIDIPIYKRDYLGVFDSPFSITVVAEGIPVGNDDVLKVSDAIEKFN